MAFPPRRKSLHRQPPPWFLRELHRRDRRLNVRWDVRASRWRIEHWNSRWRSWDTILHVVYRNEQGRAVTDHVRPLDRTVLEQIDSQDTYKKFGVGSVPRKIEDRLDSRELLHQKQIHTDTVEMAREMTKIIAPKIYEGLTHTKLGRGNVEAALSGEKSLMNLDPVERAKYIHGRRRRLRPGDMTWSLPNS